MIKIFYHTKKMLIGKQLTIANIIYESKDGLTVKEIEYIYDIKYDFIGLGAVKKIVHELKKKGVIIKKDGKYILNGFNVHQKKEAKNDRINNNNNNTLHTATNSRQNKEVNI